MLRGFTDGGGTEWRVWEVLPTTPTGRPETADALNRMSLNGTAYANGWLCFESPREKRRLAPIPSGWEFLDVPHLEKLCGKATVVPRRAIAAAETA
jgi:hypothetical protein